MALLKFKNKGIKAISSVVPKKVVKTRDLAGEWSVEHLEKFIAATGIEERRFVNESQCSSDLCMQAAKNIFEKTDIKKEDINMLIYVTQTPDYKVPGTSIAVQEALGLSKNIITYDLCLACSGFIHGVLMAYTFLESPEIENVMVMVGDTLSKVTSPQDHGTGLLLGDAGTATIVGKSDKYGESFFSICTDGANFESVYIPAGGAKMPSSSKTMEPEELPDGSIRTKEQLIMVGDDVFSFAISELPKDIKRLLEFSSKTLDEVDYCVFHQSNSFMMNYIAKKTKVDKSKILHSIEKFGNTAGTSIPLCLTANRECVGGQTKTIVMNAIGAGFTYGTVLLNLVDCIILELDEL